MDLFKEIAPKSLHCVSHYVNISVTLVFLDTTKQKCHKFTASSFSKKKYFFDKIKYSFWVLDCWSGKRILLNILLCIKL